jgi:hydrogenase small subunit
MKMYWLQCGGCGGDTQSFLNATPPDLSELFQGLDIDLLWHPTLSNESQQVHRELLEDLVNGKQPLDFLCVEGSVLCGPDGSGWFDQMFGHPKKEWVERLARQARYVLAVGTCASFGGFGVNSETGAIGLQFRQDQAGGLLGIDFLSKSGLPVINLPGCPCHPGILSSTIALLSLGGTLELDTLNCPMEWYGMLVHQGCTRNEYHEYRVEDHDFGDNGCLFFHLGCHGPLAQGPCNKMLWNQRSSKTRAGVPCLGCTLPAFPQDYPFFSTQNIEGIPLHLPSGVERAHYLAYKGMAAAAAPTRLRQRKTPI